MAFNPNEPRDEKGKWAYIPGYVKDKMQTGNEAAEALAVENKIAKKADYEGLHPQAAQDFNESLTILKAKFDLPELSEISVGSSVGDSANSFAGLAGSYSAPNHAELIINKKQINGIYEVGETKFFEKPEMKFFEARNVKGLAIHEGYHYVQRQRFSNASQIKIVSDAFQASKNLSSESSLSEYSKLNYREYFAELGTAKYNGRNLNDIYTLNRHTKSDFDKIKALWDLL